MQATNAQTVATMWHNRPQFRRFILLEGGAHNAAIARLLLAYALWLTIEGQGDGSQWQYISQSFASTGWNPKGLVKILNLWTHGAPSLELVAGIGAFAKWSLIAMGLGLFSRLASICAAISTTLLISLYWSFGPYWSHASNVQLLAALAFMFARSGDRLSVDWVIRKLLRRPDPVVKHNGGYWWPVLFAELATHMFMFGAFYSKFTIGDGFWWAWSDNLRNSIGVTWGLYRFDPPVIADWIANNPIIYRTAGMLQLIAQSTTIFAIFFARRPVTRAILGGSFFMLEIIGLGRVFAFWHPFWIPLCFLSVDWEWFGRLVRARYDKLRSSRAKSEKSASSLQEPQSAAGRST